MINWLKKNKNRLSLRGIEKELGIPETTLSQVTRDNNPIPLPKKWVVPLIKLGFDMQVELTVEEFNLWSDSLPSNGYEVDKVFIFFVNAAKFSIGFAA